MHMCYKGISLCLKKKEGKGKKKKKNQHSMTVLFTLLQMLI